MVIHSNPSREFFLLAIVNILQNIIIIIIFILLSQAFPGTFPLELVVNPTTQASIL
jgi:hypothetical protein